MPSGQFEQLIAQVVEKLGYKAAAMHSTLDGGVEVEAVRPYGMPTQPVLITVRRYSGTLRAGAVQELVDKLAAHPGATGAMLITTGKIAQPARDLAESKGIASLDGEQLVGMLRRFDIYRGPEPTPPPG
jgi:restriction endonuclease Mrr